jgi:hypothetical protein
MESCIIDDSLNYITKFNLNANIPNFRLSNGSLIPALGFGTFKASDVVKLHNSISFAIKQGNIEISVSLI